MRKRSTVHELDVWADKNPPARRPELEPDPYVPENLTGTICSDCGQPQYHTFGGDSCRNGHGGAAPVGQVLVPPAPESVADDVNDPTFGNMNAAKEQPIAPAFERITTRILIDQPLETYEKLEAELQIGEQRSDHGTLMKALDKAEVSSRLAHRLWVTAKIERERWELENWPVFGQMRSEATAVLQREKDQKARNKQITEDDIKGMAATMFPEEWPRQELKRVRYKAMVESMQNLVTAWESRCRSLQTMLSKSR